MTHDLDPIQGLIDYVNEIKPFHSKILEVAVAYSQSDDVDITISEELEFVISLFYPTNADDDDVPLRDCLEGWGVVWDRQSPYIVVDASLSPQTVSLSGDQSAFFDPGTRFEIREPRSPVGSPLVGSPVTVPAIAGSEISHATLAELGSPSNEQIPGDSVWHVFTKIDTTLDLSSLVTGDDYMIFYHSSFGNAVGNTTVNSLRIVEEIGSPLPVGSPRFITVPNSRTRFENFGNAVGVLQNYGFMTSFTSTGNDLRLQAFSTAGLPEISFPRALALSLTELGSNAAYSQDTTQYLNLVVWTDTAAEVIIGNGTDDYLVFWCSTFQIDSVAARLSKTGIRIGVGSPEIPTGSPSLGFTFEDYNATGSPTFNAGGSPPQNIRVVTIEQPADTSDERVYAGFTIFKQPNTNTKLNIVANDNFATSDLIYASICAIRLNAFEDYFASYDVDEVLGAARDINNFEFVSGTQHRTSTPSAQDWGIFSSWLARSGNPTYGYNLFLGQDLGSPVIGSPFGVTAGLSPNLRSVIGIQPQTRGEGTQVRVGTTISDLSSISSGTELDFIMTGVAGASTAQAFQKSIVGFTWALPGTPGVPGAPVSEPLTAKFFKYQALSVDYDQSSNTTVVGARELSLRGGFLGSPVILGGSPGGSPFAEGSPPLSGTEFFFPPYAAGSISNGDVFICYDVVATNQLRIFTRPSVFYGSPIPGAGSPNVGISRWRRGHAGSPLPGSPKRDYGSPPLPGSPKIVTGSPATYPNFGSPDTADNTITIKAVSTAPFIYGREVEIRNAAEPTLNKKYNILSAVDLGGSPELVELTMLEPILTDTTFDGELIFTPDAWSNIVYCSDVPPEFLQTHWMEQLDQTWRFGIGSPITGSPRIESSSVLLEDNFQLFILEADSVANTYVVEGDQRFLLTSFGSPLFATGSPIGLTVMIQHAVSPPFVPFGSPIGFTVTLSANNGTTIIRSVTYDVDTNRSTLAVDGVSVSTPTGWITQ